jgi:hypothetical protein
MRSLVLCAVGAVLVIGAAAATPKEPPEWTAQQLWDHFSQVPGDQIQQKKLTAAEAKQVQQDQAVKKTEEFYPREEPRDAGSLRFYYDTAKGQYWMRRVNKRNPSEPDWMAGPFDLPKKK